MSFNPNATYTTVTDVDGTTFFLQSGLVFDRLGNSWATVPPSRSGAVGPSAFTAAEVVSVKALAAGAGKVRMAVIGCSYEAFNGLTTIGSNSYSYHQSGYVNWANIALGGVLRIENYGAGGESTATVHARVSAVLAATTARIVLIGGGMENDAQDGAVLTTTALASTRARSDFLILRSDYLAVMGSGRQLITRTCAPRGPGASPTAPQRAYQQIVSALIREWSQNNGIPCLDLYGILADPSTGNGISAGSYGYGDAAISTVDNTHMTFTGTCNAGIELARLMLPFVPLSATAFGGGPEDAYAATVPNGNFPANGKMLGTGGTIAGGVTGTLASSWAVNGGSVTLPTAGGAVLSKVNDRRARSRGEWQQITLTGISRGFVPFYQSGAIGAELIGKSLYLQAEFEGDAANWGGASGNIGTIPSLSLALYNVSFTLLASYTIMATQPGGDSTSVCPNGMLFMDGIVVPATCTAWILTLNAVGIGVMRFGNVQLRQAYS